LEASTPSHAISRSRSPRIRQGGSILLSRLDLTRRKLGAAPERLTLERGFHEHAMQVKMRQDGIDGPVVAARELVGFLEARAAASSRRSAWQTCAAG